MKMPTYRPVWNWRKKTNENGQYPIHVRISLNRSTRYYPVEVPRKIRKEEWSGKPNSWVKNTHPFAFEINGAIKEVCDVLDGLIRR